MRNIHAYESLSLSISNPNVRYGTRVTTTRDFPERDGELPRINKHTRLLYRCFICMLGFAYYHLGTLMLDVRHYLQMTCGSVILVWTSL